MTDNASTTARPQARINFIYLHATDMEAMRAFYRDALGCSEIHYRPIDEHGYGWSVIDMGCFQFMIHPDKSAVKLEGWSMQPGWDGGTVPGLSWSVVVRNEDLPQVIARLREMGSQAFHEKPQWCQDSYWSFPVQDPMGNTVEVHSIPDERPESTEWTE
ncbi:VOC family protein [bacterium]|nr:VOC family protein [bacterium]